MDASQRLRYDLDSLSNRYRCGRLNTSLVTLAKEPFSCVITFLIILAEPLQSALINCPLDARYKPLLSLFPDGRHPSGF